MQRASKRICAAGPRIFLDLCWDQDQTVEVYPDGWRMSGFMPSQMHRSIGARPLPEPISGGDFGRITEVLTVRNLRDLETIRLWLISALDPYGPYRPLILVGPTGSGKSLAAAFLKALIDPNRVDCVALPKHVNTFRAVLASQHVTAFDHVARLTDERVSRLLVGSRPAIVSLSPCEPASPALEKLLRGSEFVALRSPGPQKYIIEAELRRRFAAIAPELLGSLLDAVDIDAIFNRRHEQGGNDL